MQTFLPFQDFAKCAHVLDNQRLNKQIIECKQIAMAITGESTAWANHPTVEMWHGYEPSLAAYGATLYWRWRQLLDLNLRGGKRKHKAGEWIASLINTLDQPIPPWLTPAVCSAYRALLLAKDPDWYGQFGWSEEPDGDSARIFEMIKAQMDETP